MTFYLYLLKFRRSKIYVETKWLRYRVFLEKEWFDDDGSTSW